MPIEAEEGRLLQERRGRASAAEQVTRQLVRYGAIAAVLLIALVGWLVTRSILRPVAALSAGASRVGRGEYQQAVAVARDDELGRLAVMFNHMAAQIAAREQALSEQDWMNTSLARLSRLLEGARDPARLGAKMLSEPRGSGRRETIADLCSREREPPISWNCRPAYASENAPKSIVRGQGLDRSVFPRRQRRRARQGA